MYDVKEPKDKALALKNDSASMGYAAFLKEEWLKVELTGS